MTIKTTIDQLERNKDVFKSHFEQIPEGLIKWKPDQKKWSLLEIVCHLYDEELEDFRSRLRHVANTPDLKMPPIDPEGWVVDRNYAAQDFEKKVSDFLLEREQSIAWLRNLDVSVFENAYAHPKYGPLTGRFFLSNWLAHDYLHMRQILSNKYSFLEMKGGAGLLYAGGW